MLILILIAVGAAGLGATHPAGMKKAAKFTACAVSFGMPKMCHKSAPVAPTPPTSKYFNNPSQWPVVFTGNSADSQTYVWPPGLPAGASVPAQEVR